MRKLIIAALLAAGSATAETPPILFRIGCDGGDIVIQLKVNQTGMYQLPNIPHDVCGKDI